MDRGAWQAGPWGCKEKERNEANTSCHNKNPEKKKKHAKAKIVISIKSPEQANQHKLRAGLG